MTRDGVTTDVRYLRYEKPLSDAQSGSLARRFGRGVRLVLTQLLDGTFRRLPWGQIMLTCAPVMVGLGAMWLAVRAVSLLGWVGLIPAVLVMAGAWILLIRMRMLLVSDGFDLTRQLARAHGETWEGYRALIGELSQEIGFGSDETLIVGHSFGGIAAIFAAEAALARAGPTDRLSLMTLGAGHGLMLAQKGDGRDQLADAIATLCSDDRVFWLDVSSPRDTFSTPLTDPLLLIGERAKPGMTSPRVISARLANAPRIPGDRRTVFSAMRRHMGYLLTPQEGSGFDYTDTVTGHQTLAERFGLRNNSPKARMWHG